MKIRNEYGQDFNIDERDLFVGNVMRFPSCEEIDPHTGKGTGRLQRFEFMEHKPDGAWILQPIWSLPIFLKHFKPYPQRHPFQIFRGVSA